MPRTAEQQHQLFEEVTQLFEHTTISQLVTLPPSPTADLTKDQALALLTMSDKVARAVIGGETTAAVRTMCETLLSWIQKNRLLVQARRSNSAFTPSTAPNFVNHFVGDRNRVHYLIDLVTPPFDQAPRAFIEKVYMKMLASASASWQVDATVFVAHRDWQAITAYERMWAVAAAYDYVERIQREYGRRRSLGLPTAPINTEHATSLSKYTPRARSAGAEAARNRRSSQVDVFKRWSAM